MLLSGVGDGDRFDDTWLFDAVPERAAAVQLVVDAGPFGIEPRSITGLRVRASCRSEAAGALRGAQILGWVTRGTGAHPGGVWSQVAVADEDGAVDWALSGGDQALPFVVERPHRLAFQCRPDLDDGDDLELSEVFLGYVEVRLSYRTR